MHEGTVVKNHEGLQKPKEYEDAIHEDIIEMNYQERTNEKVKTIASSELIIKDNRRCRGVRG